MKMIKIYILILFFTSFLQINYSQNSTSSFYFPLQVGNKWLYDRFQLPSATSSVLQVKITKDTVVNNKTYYFLHHYPEQPDYWIRFDTSDGILYHHIEIEVPFVKLSANTGDTMNYICSGVRDTLFFNIPTKLKKFYKYENVPHSSSGTEIQFAEHFGQTYYFEYYSSITGSSYLYAWIKGCSINGIVYGDTTMPLGNIQTSNQTPAVSHLSQNSPNPFNPVTSINFDIPNSLFTRLIVFDQLGREVETLVNEQLFPGSYKYEWNAADYPSGIYFYKLQAVDYVETKKMVLIK